MKNCFLIAIILYTLSFCVFSCSKEKQPLVFDNTECFASLRTRSEEPDSLIVPRLGRKLVNPYSIEVMQLACDSLCGLHHHPRMELQPTDLYVRFLPADSTEYNDLLALGSELFNFPLDYEIIGDMGEYRDSSLLESQMTWQYTTLPIGTSFPNVLYEVLDTCFIPLSDNEFMPIQSLPASTQSTYDIWNFESELEQLACDIADPTPDMNGGGVLLGNGINSNGFSYPSGTVRVKKNSTSYVPIKKVKVKAWHIVKIASTYTNENGAYCITTSFSKNPHYSIVFENQVGFDIRGSIFSLGTVSKSFGKQSKSGYHMTIPLSDEKWYAAVLNNSAYEYYKRCNTDHRIAPPYDLRIVGLSDAGTLQGSGAPMLKHLGYQYLNDYSLSELLVLLRQIPSSALANALVGLLKYFLPDIVIEVDSNNYNTIAQSVYHELSHASHFSIAGTAQWLKIIGGTIRYSFPENQGYGEGLENDSIQDFLALGEAWAFANERVFEKENGFSICAGSDYWLNRFITSIYNLIDQEILTEKQILSCLPASVSSVEDLYNRLRVTYPLKATALGSVFSYEESLRSQSHWVIQNGTSQVVTLTIRSSGFERVDSVPCDSSYVIASIPDTTTAPNTLLSTYSSYRPEEIIISLPSGETVYEESNGTVIIPMERSLWNPDEWCFTIVHQAAGNTDTNSFVFTLNDSDL